MTTETTAELADPLESSLGEAMTIADAGFAPSGAFSSELTFTGALMYQPDEGRPIAFADLVKQHVLDALADPAVIAAALIKLPQPIRDQVRIMLDALEQGSSREGSPQ